VLDARKCNIPFSIGGIGFVYFRNKERHGDGGTY